MRTLLVIFALAFTFACSSDSDKIDPGKSVFFVSADIDAEKFHWEGIVDNTGEVAGRISKDLNGGDALYLGVAPTDNKYLAFNIVNFLGEPGTYDCYGAEVRKLRSDPYSSVMNATTVGFKSPNGKVVFTKVDENVIEGTFYFDVYSDWGKGNKKFEVRNGKFRVPYE